MREQLRSTSRKLIVTRVLSAHIDLSDPSYFLVTCQTCLIFETPGVRLPPS